MRNLIGYQFGRGGAWDLPVTVLVSSLLHLILFLLLGHTAFLTISGSGQPSFVAIDLMQPPAAEPGDGAATPPPSAEKQVNKPEPKPLEKKVERTKKTVPVTPAKDDIPLKKVVARATQAAPPVPPREARKDETKPSPPQEITKPQTKPFSEQAPSAARTTSASTGTSESAATPISALEGAREGVDTNSNYYIKNLVAQITRRWLPPANLRYARDISAVIIYFKVQKDGRITDVSIETSSGRQDLDLSAKRAVIETNSIPPLPPNLMKDSTLGVHFKFIPKVDEKG